MRSKFDLVVSSDDSEYGTWEMPVTFTFDGDQAQSEAVLEIVIKVAEAADATVAGGFQEACPEYSKGVPDGPPPADA